MPLLMLISGFCFHFSFEKKTTRELLISRITPLLQAIFIFSILSLILCEFKKPTSGRWVDSCFGIWFLWSIIASCIPLTLIIKSNYNKIIKILLLIFSPLFIILFPNYDIHLYVYPYFILGFIFAFFVKNDILKKVTKISWISIPLFILMLIFYKKEHYIYITGIYGREKSFFYYFIINLFRFSIGILGSISFINTIIYL